MAEKEKRATYGEIDALVVNVFPTWLAVFPFGVQFLTSLHLRISDIVEIVDFATVPVGYFVLFSYLFIFCFVRIVLPFVQK